jgi:enoyl-CoA hydratase/carnithine racemase
MTDTVRLAMSGAHVALIEIDRPPTNALDAQACATLLEVFDRLRKQHDVRAIVLTGSGRAFCSGADLKQAAGDGLSLFGKLIEQVAGSRAPVIAAVNGYCIGGGLELALSCDLRIASTEAKFVCAGVNVGLMASTYQLPRLIGVSRAKAMLLTGLPFDAATAEAWGLVITIHRPPELRAAALELAQRVASRAPLAVEAAKRCADRASDLSPDEAGAMLAREMPGLLASDDHGEAISAFREKREPVFSRK